MKRKICDEYSSNKHHKQTPSDTLPDEIILHIISFLSTKFRMKMRFVCKRFDKLIREPSDLWSFIDLTAFATKIDAPTLETIACYAKKNLRKFHFRYPEDKLHQMQPPPELKTLDEKVAYFRERDIITESYSIFNNWRIVLLGKLVNAEILAKHCPNLEEILLENAVMLEDQFMTLIQTCKKLKKLHFNPGKLIKDEVLIGIAKNCKNLTTFWCKGLPQVSMESLTIFGESLGRQLKSFSIPRSDLSELQIIGLLEHLPNLEELDLRTTRVSDVTVKTLIQCTKLRRLNISQTEITDVGLQQIVENLKLEELHCAGVARTPEGLSQILKCKNLKSLSLSFRFFDNIDKMYKVIEKICKQLTNLKKLKLDTIADDNLVAIISLLPNLEEVVLQECPITNKSCEYLTKALKLKSIDITNSNQVSKDGILIFSKCKLLESLKIDANVTTDDIKHLIFSLPRLFSLKLIYTEDRQNIPLEELREWIETAPQNNPNIDGDALQKFIEEQQRSFKFIYQHVRKFTLGL